MKKEKNKLIGIVIFLLLIVFIGLPVKVHAIEPKITDVLITNDLENVLLYARLVNGFKPDMELAILAGIPAVFNIYLEVFQERPLLWDKKITGKEIKRTMKYDNLKKTFSIITNGKTEPVIFSDFESAQKAMMDFNGMIAVPLSSLVKGNNYYAMIKVKMDKVRLPLHMEYVFFFISLWDFETSWYQQRFSY
jgi:hypothetical protein